MLFQKKISVCMALTDRGLRYLVFNPQNKQIIEHDEIVFDSLVIEEGKLVNRDTFRSTLEYLVKEKKWKNKKLHFIVPDQFVTMKIEKIPALLDLKETRDYINLQLGSKIRLPFNRPHFDFQVLERDEENQSILLIAYPKEFLDPIQELFEEVGLIPVVADVSFLSLYRAYQELETHKNSEKDHLLIVQWQKCDIGITVFHKNYPQFNRHTQLQEISQSWSYNDQKKWVFEGSNESLDFLVKEQLISIERFMEFYRYSVMNGEDAVTDILVTGDFPDLEKIQKQMTDQYGISVKQIKLPDQLPDEYSSLYGLILKKNGSAKEEKKSSKKVKHPKNSKNEDNKKNDSDKKRKRKDK